MVFIHSFITKKIMKKKFIICFVSVSVTWKHLNLKCSYTRSISRSRLTFNLSKSFGFDFQSFVLYEFIVVVCTIFLDLQSKACYEKALEELSDPLLPTRGHALRTLSALLKKRNQYAVRNEEQLFTIFETYLKHEDTYLYLAAVDGLIALVDVQHRTVMPMLCKKFIDMRTDGKCYSQAGMELNLKKNPFDTFT